jgi:ribosomal protein L22
MDLFDELAELDAKPAKEEDEVRAAHSLRTAAPADECVLLKGKQEEQPKAKEGAPPKAEVKNLLARQLLVHGSPRRLQLIATALVGKNYPAAKHALDVLRRNSGARAGVRAVDNAKRRAVEKWGVTDDRRLVVEQAWTGKAMVSPRLRIHARAKTGKMHRRWGKLWVLMRYISPDDDQQLLQRMTAALEKHGVEKHRVRYLLRYGPRKTVFRVSKESGLTRQQGELRGIVLSCLPARFMTHALILGRAYLKMLSENLPEFRKPKFDSSKNKKGAKPASAAVPIAPGASPSVAKPLEAKQ